MATPWTQGVSELRDFAPALHKAVTESLSVIIKTIDTYGADAIALSFNGGKDCTVVLHLLQAVLAQQQPPVTLSGIRVVYFASSDFPEVTSFLEASEKRYGFTLEQHSGYKAGLLKLVKEGGIKAVIMGTRATDPHGGALDHSTPTTAGWPDVMRVNPILHWSYVQVWQYLLKFNVPFCSLYSAGYTSIGSVGTTYPNPALRIHDADIPAKDGPAGRVPPGRAYDTASTIHARGPFLPAWMLVEDADALERRGRTSKSTVTQPSPCATPEAKDTAGSDASGQQGAREEDGGGGTHSVRQ